jgi:hypothetical protein
LDLRRAKRAEPVLRVRDGFWGGGLMREALCPVFGYGFNLMKFERMYAFVCIDDDAPSAFEKTIACRPCLSLSL